LLLLVLLVLLLLLVVVVQAIQAVNVSGSAAHLRTGAIHILIPHTY